MLKRFSPALISLKNKKIYEHIINFSQLY